MNDTCRTIKKLFFLLLLAIPQIHLSAQMNKADSLKALLSGNDDTVKVNTLNQLTKALWYYQLDTAAAYNAIALKLADSLSYQNGLAEANRCRGVILSFRYDSTGMPYLVKALNIFKQLNNKRGIAATLNNQNEYYSRQKQYSKALDVLFQSLQLFEELKDKEGSGAVTNQIGNIYNVLSNYSVALEYYLKALVIRKEINDKPGTAFTLTRVGDMYFKLNQLPEALGNYQQALKMAQDIGRNTNIMDVATNIGSVYQKQKKYSEALAYFNMSLKAEEEYFGKDHVARSYIHIGQVYYEQKKYTLSLFNFQKALSIAEKGSIIEKAEILHSLGQLYYEQGNFPKALENCLASLDIGKQKNENEIVKNASFTLSQIYASMHKYEEAYLYHALYTTARDSLQIEDLNQKLAALQQSFEIKNRQAQIDLLSRDKELQQSELNRQKQQRYAFILGIIFVVLVAVVLARNNRQKQKANQLLEKTLSNLKSTQAQLIQSEKMASLGQLTAGIAHEIQNPLNFVNNFSDVNTELIEELKNEKMKAKNQRDELLENDLLNDIEENEKKINHHGKRADAIVKGMLQHSRRNSDVKEPVDINALADEYLRLAYQGMRAKDKAFNATMKSDFDSSIGKIDIIPQDIGRVLLNLYNNAFYALNEKIKMNNEKYEPTLRVETKKEGANVMITVSDNGNGIPQSIIDKIFQPFFTTKPTGQGTGLGLSLAYDIVKTHGGEIKVNSIDGTGTTFIIQLPNQS